jgi:hypothetical protein
VSVVVESHIEFDFTNAISVTKHDKQSGHGNSNWDGVDFCIEDVDGSLWLEVKSWDFSQIAPHRRGGQQRSFVHKMRSSAYTKELRAKFLGTTAYLAWTNQFQPTPTRFIMVFEPPRSIDAALLVTQNTHLKSQLPNLVKWSQPITAAVLPLSEWNTRFPDYPARKVS